MLFRSEFRPPSRPSPPSLIVPFSPPSSSIPPLPPLSSLHTSPLPFSFLSTSLLSSSPSVILPSFPLFSRPLPSPQGSGRSPAEPSTRRASAAVCPALASFCGAERREARACTARWCTRAQAAALWTAPALARRRPRGAAPARPQFGPLLRPPADRGPRHPGASSLAVSPAPPPASRRRSRLLAASRRARGRDCACGDPGEAEMRPRTQADPRLA